jgi:hypothetical protein
MKTISFALLIIAIITFQSSASGFYIENILDSKDTLYLEVCDTFISPSGKIITESGFYSDTIPDYLNQDSIIKIKLTVNKSSFSSVTTFCFSILLNNGHAISTPGIFLDSMKTWKGCDSITLIHHTRSGKPSNFNTNVLIQGNKLIAELDSARYQWVENCGINIKLIPGETNRSLTLTKPGSYAVIITPEYCSELSNCIEVTSGFDEENLENLNLYPNPTNGKIFLEFNSSKNNIQIHIKNILGQTILSKHFETLEKAEFNIDAPKGLYFMEITNDNEETIVLKFIKE